MSADEFDPRIERLFSSAPSFPDSALFEAEVAARLAQTSRVRTAALSVAGLIGGLFAVREVVQLNFSVSSSGAAASSRAADQGLQMAGVDMAAAAQSLLERAGLQDLALGSLGGIQLFWITAGALVALLAAGAMKLSQEI